LRYLFVAKRLLAQGKQVKVVVRHAEKAACNM
jgi:hypothetical protein